MTGCLFLDVLWSFDLLDLSIALSVILLVVHCELSLLFFCASAPALQYVKLHDFQKDAGDQSQALDHR